MIFHTRLNLLTVGLCCLAMHSAAAQAPVAELVQAAETGDVAARVKAIHGLAALKESAAPAVGSLTELLKDRSPDVRAHAAYALGEIGAPAKPAVAALAALLKDSDQSVRRQAVKAIGVIRPGPQVMIPLFIELVDDPDAGVRQRILQAVTEAGPQAVPGLIEALKHEKAAYWACLVLREIGPEAKDAVPSLTALLKSPRLEVRREATLALGAMHAEATSAVPEIVALLDDKQLQDAATFALGQIGKIPTSAEEKVRAHAKSENKLLSTVSLWALARVHPEDKALAKEAAEQIIGRLQDQDPFVRAAAARALADLQLDPAITFPVFQRVLASGDETTIRHAMDALATLGARAVPRLIQALKNETLRLHAAQVLGQIGPEAAPATDALASLVGNENSKVASEAALALAKIGPAAKSSIPALIAALEHPECDSTHAIVYALGKFGPIAIQSKSALIEQMSSESSVAILAAWALSQVAPNAPEVAATAVPTLVAGLSHDSPESRLMAAETLAGLKSVARDAVPALEKATKDENSSVREAASEALRAIRGGAAK